MAADSDKAHAVIPSPLGGCPPVFASVHAVFVGVECARVKVQVICWSSSHRYLQLFVGLHVAVDKAAIR
mgnify:CR=1 FL=1